MLTNKVLKLFLFFLVHIAFADAHACFPKNPISSFDVPERYAAIPSDLMDVLRKSYLKHTKENKFLDNSFWSSNADDKCTWPDSLWDALDKLGPREIYTIVKVYQLSEKGHVWSTIGAIRNIWYGTSFGFTFEGADANLDDMVAYIKKNKSFCKDNETISKREHGGQTCWRQIPRDRKGSGLHFCLGAGKPTEVHIDHNQVALGRIPFTDTCLYDPFAVAKHYKDLKSPPPKTIFDLLQDEANDLNRLLAGSYKCEGFQKYLFEINVKKMLSRVSPDKLTSLATLGDRSIQAGIEVMKQINRDKEQLYSFTTCTCI